MNIRYEKWNFLQAGDYHMMVHAGNVDDQGHYDFEVHSRVDVATPDEMKFIANAPERIATLEQALRFVKNDLLDFKDGYEHPDLLIERSLDKIDAALGKMEKTK